MAVPYTFSTATGSLPLSQLDSNFSTAITIGNTAVVLGDTISTINNLTLSNVAITSVSTAFPNGYLANSNVIVGTTTLTLGSTVTSINGLSLSNVTINSGNVTISNVTTTNVSATTANISGTANVSTLAVVINATIGGNATVTGNVGIGTSSPTSKLHVFNSTSDVFRLERDASNQWRFQLSAGALLFSDAIAATERMRIDSSGNVGIGVTPSAWLSTWRAIQNTGGALYSNGSNQRIGFNAYLDSATAFRYIATGFATDYQQGAGNGSHAWWIAPSGTAGNLITFTQAMTLDASGRLLVGATSATGAINKFTVGTGLTTTNAVAVVNTANANIDGLSISNWDGSTTTYGPRLIFNNSGRGTFYVGGSDGAYNFDIARTWGTPDLRIDSSGNVQVSAGAVMPYAPAPTGIAAATTLTNANIQGQIISATGTTYTITMPLGTTLETLATWATTNIAYDFFVINTASGVITMAVNTGVTSLGSLTVSIGASAHFRIRRTAANTFVLYRLV